MKIIRTLWELLVWKHTQKNNWAYMADSWQRGISIMCSVLWVKIRRSVWQCEALPLLKWLYKGHRDRMYAEVGTPEYLFWAEKTVFKTFYRFWNSQIGFCSLEILREEISNPVSRSVWAQLKAPFLRWVWVPVRCSAQETSLYVGEITCPSGWESWVG